VKQIFKLPILAIMLSLAALAIAQAQHSNASKVGGNSVADLEQLRTPAENGDPDAQYQSAERYRVGIPVEQNMAAVMVWYRNASNANGGRSDGASGGDNDNSDNGRSGDSNNGGGNSGDGNTGGGNTGDRNTGDRNTGGGNTSGGNTGDRGQGDGGQGDGGRGDGGRDR